MNLVEYYTANSIKVKIDTTQFKELTTIVELITIELFSKFSDYYYSNGNNRQLEVNVLDLFQKVYEGCNIKNRQRLTIASGYEDTLEQLSRAALATEVFSNFEELLKGYLQIVKKDKLIATLDNLKNRPDYPERIYEIKKHLNYIDCLKVIIGPSMFN
jgi:hypothetical protein